MNKELVDSIRESIHSALRALDDYEEQGYFTYAMRAGWKLTHAIQLLIRLTEHHFYGEEGRWK